MPWNKDDDGKGAPPPGQGPWGNPSGQKPQEPRKPSNNWGNRNQGPGQLPPELDDIVNKAKNSFNSMMPGGLRRGWVLPVLAVGALWVFNSIYQVQPDQRGMVLRFGAFNRMVEPGLAFAPWLVERMELLPVAAENQVSVGDQGDEGLMLTGDQNMLDIRFKVLWKISDAQKFLFNVSEQESLVKAVAESAMREVVGRTPATEALTGGRFTIQQQVTEITQRTLDHYNAGVQVTGLTLEGVDAPGPVLDAFEEVQRAQQDQTRSINEADQYKNQKLRAAEGDKNKRVADAEGYKAQVVNTAKGEAQRFDQIYSEYAKSKDVTRQRLYLETMEKVIGNSSKVIIEPGKQGNGVVPYLPLPAVAPPQAQTGSTQQ